MSRTDPLDVFRTEAAELLEQIEQGLLDLEHRLDDRSLIDAVFRGLHTLKGSGAMFGFDALAAFTHHCETAFDSVRKGHAPASVELVAAVLAARDHMRALVEDADGDHAGVGAMLLDRLRDAIETNGIAAPADTPTSAAPVAAAPAVVADAAPAHRWRLRFSLPTGTLRNGTNPLTLLDELRDMGPCEVIADTSSVPPLDRLDPTELHLA